MEGFTFALGFVVLGTSAVAYHAVIHSVDERGYWTATAALLSTLFGAGGCFYMVLFK